MARHKNTDWDLGDGVKTTLTWEQASVSVLMDIRDELQRLNRVLTCPNFTAVPEILRSIRRQLPTRRRKKTKA